MNTKGLSRKHIAKLKALEKKHRADPMTTELAKLLIPPPPPKTNDNP